MLVKNYKSATPAKNGQSHYQVTEKSRIRKEVDHVVSVVENRLHKSILTAMYSVIMRWIELAAKLIIESSAHEQNGVVQSPDQRDFPGNTEDTLDMTASSCTEINFIHSRNDDTRKNEIIEDVDFSAVRPNYVRQMDVYHNWLKVCCLEVSIIQLLHNCFFHPLPPNVNQFKRTFS